ncbi:MAG TPA: hypothetical protein PJ991_08205, partial [Kiritimatiellia bacterium]|nr:hypothetical protein [Kiritimatiellia bacterium]
DPKSCVSAISPRARNKPQRNVSTLYQIAMKLGLYNRRIIHVHNGCRVKKFRPTIQTKSHNRQLAIVALVLTHA